MEQSDELSVQDVFAELVAIRAELDDANTSLGRRVELADRRRDLRASVGGSQARLGLSSSSSERLHALAGHVRTLISDAEERRLDVAAGGDRTEGSGLDASMIREHNAKLDEQFGLQDLRTWLAQIGSEIAMRTISDREVD